MEANQGLSQTRTIWITLKSSKKKWCKNRAEQGSLWCKRNDHWKSIDLKVSGTSLNLRYPNLDQSRLMGTKPLNFSLSWSIRLLKITTEENFKNSTWMRESCTLRAVSESRQLSKKNKFNLIRMNLAVKSIYYKRSSFSLLGRSSKAFQALSQLDWTSQIISQVVWSKI